MKTIELTDEQFAAIQNGESIVLEPPKSKVEPWEPAGGQWHIHGNGKVHRFGRALRPYKEAGTSRECRERAEVDALKLIAYARELAYQHEVAPNYVPNWSDSCISQKHYVHYDKNNFATVGFNSTICTRTRIYYPTRQIAQRLADKLNSGEVVF